MTPIDIKPEFDEASFRKMLAPMLAGEISSHRFETVHRSRSGVHIPVEVFLQYIAPQSEEPRFVAIVRDISARQKAVEELQASRQLLKTVFDTVPQYVSMEDAQGRFQIVNQAFAQTYGYEPDDLVGKTLADIAGFDKATLEISNAADRRIFETGRPAPQFPARPATSKRRADTYPCGRGASRRISARSPRQFATTSQSAANLATVP